MLGEYCDNPHFDSSCDEYTVDPSMIDQITPRIIQGEFQCSNTYDRSIVIDLVKDDDEVSVRACVVCKSTESESIKSNPLVQCNICQQSIHISCNCKTKVLD